MSFLKRLLPAGFHLHNYHIVYGTLGAYGALGYLATRGEKKAPPPPPPIVPKYLHESHGNKYELGTWEWDDAEGFFDWLTEGDNISKWEATQH